MTVQESFDNFIMSRRMADLSEKTIYDYELFVSPFVREIGLETDFNDITQEIISKYILTVLNRPISKATKATYIRHIRIYLRWCENEYGANYKSRNIKVPKTPKREVRIYSDYEVAQIFKMIRADREWLTIRNRCIIALMYDSGLRQSEIRNLRIKNISFADFRIIIRGKGDKERVVPLGTISHKFLKEYMVLCPYQSEFLFVSKYGGQMTCNSIKLMVSKLANKLPFELSSHKLRHNFATNYCIDQYERNGQVDIYRLMYLLGHAELETAQRYLHFAYEIIAAKNHISHLDKIMV